MKSTFIDRTLLIISREGLDALAHQIIAISGRGVVWATALFWPWFAAGPPGSGWRKTACSISGTLSRLA